MKVDFLVLSNPMLLMTKMHYVMYCAPFSKISPIFNYDCSFKRTPLPKSVLVSLKPSLYT